MDFFQQLHSKPNLLWLAVKWMMAFLAAFYNFIITLRNIGFDKGILPTQKMPVPVLVLGNITVGGTGKTPAAIWLIQELRKRSYFPVLLSRGYGHDEVHLFHQHLPDTPHYTAAQRVLGARQIIAELGTHLCIVLDDAFQHRYLARDCNIVLIDAIQPFGYEAPLPLGKLRETISSLRRAHFIVITKSNLIQHQTLKKLQCKIQAYTSAPQFLAKHSPIRVQKLGGEPHALEFLLGKKLLPVAGIGSPESFLRTLQELSYSLAPSLLFADHYQYSAQDIHSMQSWMQQYQAEAIITTSKDAVKLLQYADVCPFMWVLEIAFQVEDSEAFFSAIKPKLKFQRNTNK